MGFPTGECGLEKEEKHPEDRGFVVERGIRQRGRPGNCCLIIIEFYFSSGLKSSAYSLWENVKCKKV